MMSSAVPATKLWYLRKVNLLDDVDREELERVARLLLLKEIPRGEVLQLGERGSDSVFFLFKGKVGVSRIDPATGKEIMLYLVRPGEPFGALSTTKGRSESVVRVLSRSLVGYVTRRDFLRLANRANVHPRLDKLLESRLIKVENRLQELAFCDVPTRLARLLLRLSSEYPGKCPKAAGSQIALNLTQQEIGNLIAASREITSLTLNEFRREGWLAKHGSHLCIHNHSALRDEST